MKNIGIEIGLRRLPPDIVGGVDEAGRGSLIGPLVVCGIAIKNDKLNEIKVKDSKKLSREKRYELYRDIMEVADAVSIRIVSSEDIDTYRKKKTLNSLEVELFSSVIKDLISYTDTFYVDSADVDSIRFAQSISKIVDKNIVIYSEHHADERYPVVSAASIVAKVTRDNLIDKIAIEIGDFGSGYPSDPRTIRFIDEWLRKYGDYPPHVRRSWRTLDRIIGKAYRR